eukprot:723728-Rhodomonas_salina.1
MEELAGSGMNTCAFTTPHQGHGSRSPKRSAAPSAATPSVFDYSFGLGQAVKREVISRWRIGVPSCVGGWTAGPLLPVSQEKQDNSLAYASSGDSSRKVVTSSAETAVLFRECSVALFPHSISDLECEI